ncbi:helix-turn-helix domain-containing protein [Acidobacteria bacterium AH-259-O06]|nr:helix-turn-helix domain-containing protein [Acidobacteria bacterium AH-259-O06]
MFEDLLTVKEAADLTGLHQDTLRKWAWQRRVRSFKVSSVLRFKRSDLDALIVERPAETSLKGG